MGAFSPSIFLRTVLPVGEKWEDQVGRIPGFPAMVMGVAPIDNLWLTDFLKRALVQLDDSNAQNLRPSVVHEQPASVLIVKHAGVAIVVAGECTGVVPDSRFRIVSRPHSVICIAGAPTNPSQLRTSRPRRPA